MVRVSFWKLVGHEVKLRMRRRNRLPRVARIIYTIALAILLLGIAVSRTTQATQGMDYVWIFTFSFPFIAFGTSIRMVAREWRSDTIGWWLTLPLPRRTLVLAKVVAMIVRSCLIFAAFYVAMLLFSGVSLIAHHTLDAQLFMQFALIGLKWVLIGASAAPLAVAFGTLFAIVTRSEFRAIVPLFWVVLGGAWWIGIHQIAHVHLLRIDGTTADILSTTPQYWVLLLASWILGAIFVAASSYVLEKRLVM